MVSSRSRRQSTFLITCHVLPRVNLHQIWMTDPKPAAQSCKHPFNTITNHRKRRTGHAVRVRKGNGGLRVQWSMDIEYSAPHSQSSLQIDLSEFRGDVALFSALAPRPPRLFQLACTNVAPFHWQATFCQSWAPRGRSYKSGLRCYIAQRPSVLQQCVYEAVQE